MIGLLTTLIGAAANIGDKLIEDKDKKAEYAFKMQEIAQKQMEVLLNQQTYKWIDGLVKLSYASEQIIKGLIRPIGALAMLGIGVYCDIKQIPLSDSVEVILYSAFPAWGVSRHAEKSRKN